MGCDGGVIAVKRRFMRGCGEGKKAEEVDERERQFVRAHNCVLTNAPLEEPVVACELGNLYNKEAILNALLEKSLNPAFSHIRGLKDLKECKFAHNPATNSPNPFVCPITMTEFDGTHPFVLVWTTGHVLSEPAIKAVGIEELQTEYGPFQASDLVRLVPTEDLVEAQTAAMLARRERMKAAAKDKKKRKRLEAGAAEGKSETKRTASSEEDEAQERSPKARKSPPPSAAPEPAAAAAAPKSLNYAALAAKKAAAAVKQTAKKDSVYSSLFHSGTQKASETNLFIQTAGHRYTLS